ncbi:hemolysin family protein [Leptothoe kymatousa]|uniref:HlyC/CorC family transporter n=1 Tax=Leptothoe kymatousa TAU-MAC 1615 TaxID=2364775 RepID=A0ABS5XZG7_9CYAN|nr:hemolysin family protein [Leptothoe kymatousa]MBT9310971.1 HlyC/CorC family transporter [Leptothoe kymatousa TAU-MAC 1615]
MVTNILIVLALIIANGIFAMSELAVVSSRKVRLEQAARRGDRKAQAALKLAKRPDNFFSTVQVGITLISIVSGAFGGQALSAPVTQLLRQIPGLANYADTLAFPLVVAIITYLSLILGELVPKQLALTMPETIAKVIAGPMSLLSKLAAPLVTLLSFSTNLVVRLLNIQAEDGPSVTEAEIRAFIQQGTEEGTLEVAEREIMERVFRLGDRAVTSIMTPRPEITWLDLEDAPAENQQKIVASRYRRLPVCQGSLDNNLGLISVNSLLTRALDQDPLDLTIGLEQPLVIPELSRSLPLLEQFKRSRVHTALVVDEYGVIQGLVTLWDILEALVGDAPALDEPTDKPYQRDDGSWLLGGMMHIEDVYGCLGLIDLPDRTVSYYTLGGLVIHQLGRIPKATDRFEWRGFTVEVMDMDGNRVDKVLVTPPANTCPTDEG